MTPIAFASPLLSGTKKLANSNWTNPSSRWPLTSKNELIRTATARPMRSQRATLVTSALEPPLSNITFKTVDSTTGKEAEIGSEGSAQIASALINLPPGDVPMLVLQDGKTVSTNRIAQAMVILPKDRVEHPSYVDNHPVIVFGHGFSQRPQNYTTLLNTFAANGYTVIAPRVWVFSVIFSKVETEVRGLTQKLATALIVDVVRSIEIAKNGAAVHVIGHSLGGVATLASVQYEGVRQVINSTATLAPALNAAVEVPVNFWALLTDSGDELRQLGQAASQTPMLTLQGVRDVVVPDETTIDAVQFLKQGGANVLLGLMSLATHVGFEDRLNVDIPFVDVIDRFIFFLVDLLVYGRADVLQLDTAEQLEDTKKVLNFWVDNVGQLDATQMREALEGLEMEEEIDYQ